MRVEVSSAESSQVIATIDFTCEGTRFIGSGKLAQDVVDAIREDASRFQQPLPNGGYGFDPVIGTVGQYIWRRQQFSVSPIGPAKMTLPGEPYREAPASIGVADSLEKGIELAKNSFRKTVRGVPTFKVVSRNETSAILSAVAGSNAESLYSISSI